MDRRGRVIISADLQTVTCDDCQACCCRLEVMLMGDDDAPRRLTKVDDWGGEVMRRLEDGWCAALDRDTMRCTIYERRPGLCRDYEMGDSDCLVERSLYAQNHPGSFLLIAAPISS